MGRRIAVLAMLVAATGCSAPEEPNDLTVVVDSAGVRVATHAASAPSPTWEVSAQPLVQVGGASGTGEAAFARVYDGALLPDGSFVTLDIDLNEVRWFNVDASDSYLVGRKGEGPGEHQFPAWVWVMSGDSIAIWDGGLNRISLYDRSGTFARSFVLMPEGEEYPQPVGPYSTGEWLIGYYARRPTRVLGPMGSDTVTWRRSTPDGSTLQAHARQASAAWFGYEWSGQLLSGQVIFSQRPTAATDGVDWVIASSRLPEWRRYDGSGRLTEIVRLTMPFRPVTSDDRDRYIAERLETAPPDTDLESWRDAFESSVFADTFPQFEEIRSTPRGEIWVETHTAVWEDQEQWTVFSAAGALLGMLRLPPGLRLLDTDGERVLSVRTDDFDTPIVEVFEILRSQ